MELFAAEVGRTPEGFNVNSPRLQPGTDCSVLWLRRITQIQLEILG